MKGLSLFLSLISLITSGVATSEDMCQPSCDGKAPGTQLPFPFYCNKFYICLPDESMYESACDPGKEFDMEKSQCVEEPAKCVECKPSCRYSCPSDASVISFRADIKSCSSYYLCPYLTMGEKQVLCDGNTPYFNGDDCTDNESQCCDPCIAYCWEAGSLIADPTDCRRFYLCHGVGVPRKEDLLICATGNFNPEDRSCSEGTQCNQPCAGTTVH